MRTTVRLDDALLREAKAVAAGTGRTLTQLIEDALREALARRATSERPRVELPTFEGRVRPGVNLDSMSDLLDIMEGDAPS
jgi:hypothetical protein